MVVEIPDGLKFEMKISSLDLGNKLIPISKLRDFSIQYYTNPLDPFIASRVGSNLTNCRIEKDEIIVTIDKTFSTKGVLKCKITINIADSVLPLSIFPFYCPEQRTNVCII